MAHSAHRQCETTYHCGLLLNRRPSHSHHFAALAKARTMQQTIHRTCIKAAAPPSPTKKSNSRAVRSAYAQQVKYIPDTEHVFHLAIGDSQGRKGSSGRAGGIRTGDKWREIRLASCWRASGKKCCIQTGERSTVS